MNRIIIYESKTGFTEQYAKWIAEALKCKYKHIKDVSSNELNTYDQIIFGGWVMANMIRGLDKLKKMSKSPTIIFAVGSTPPFDEVITQIKTQNKLDNIPFFYFQGGFHFEKLGFMKRVLLKTLKKSTNKKENPTPQEEFMAQMLGTSFNNSSQEQISPLLEYINTNNKNDKTE